MLTESPNIYDFHDYREYLQAWLAAKPSRSQRSFARRVGCSPSLVSQVLSDTRVLDLERARSWASTLKLDEHRCNYFCDLVELDHGATKEHRSSAWARMMAARAYQSAAKVQGAIDRVFSAWYYTVVLELVRCEGALCEAEWLVKHAYPTITTEQAQDAIDTLVMLGMIDRNGNPGPGADAGWTTKWEAPSTLKDHYRWMLQYSREALLTFEPHQRDFQCMTFALPASKMPALKERIHAFHQDVMALCHAGPETPDQVMYLGVQTFPMSTRTGNDES